MYCSYVFLALTHLYTLRMLLQSSESYYNTTQYDKSSETAQVEYGSKFLLIKTNPYLTYNIVSF